MPDRDDDRDQPGAPSPSPPAPSPAPRIVPLPGADCWNVIGTGGDKSCPELEPHVHCRNCPVYASAARRFFDRPAPEGYLAEWTRWLGGSASAEGGGGQGGVEAEDDAAFTAGERDRLSVLIFRLGPEWLAFRTTAVAEVTTPRPVHRIPHRSDDILMGLVNLRGQLQLCVSLHGLLGVSTPEDPAASRSRLVVLRDRARSEAWVFAADEVLGVHRLAKAQVLGVSSSLANPEVSFSQAILSWQGRSVSFLDEQRVFAALGSLGE
ncbi:CheW-like domain protein [Aquisphaera giovannonii]|uniref:Chemotaxis protein CheW n=1 Tax=Aquisphaera giovannonii TaxID=406548 RepID=A0A5B9VTP3_9BACT|nr:chemotaxis protein CheW [Aquisphaera giovannonii]QEH31896.1 CheW-like domain protein [Aquisphaera giovannonii]